MDMLTIELTLMHFSFHKKALAESTSSYRRYLAFDFSTILWVIKLKKFSLAFVVATYGSILCSPYIDLYQKSPSEGYFCTWPSSKELLNSRETIYVHVEIFGVRFKLRYVSAKVHSYNLPLPYYRKNEVEEIIQRKRWKKVSLINNSLWTLFPCCYFFRVAGGIYQHHMILVIILFLDPSRN